MKFEDALSKLGSEYPHRMSMMDTAEQLREKFYQGLRQEMNQRLIPAYEVPTIAYLVLIKKAGQLKFEFVPQTLLLME